MTVWLSAMRDLPATTTAAAAGAARTAAARSAAALRHQRVVRLVALLARRPARHFGRDDRDHHFGVLRELRRIVQHFRVGAVGDAQPELHRLELLVDVEPDAAARLHRLQRREQRVDRRGRRCRRRLRRRRALAGCVAIAAALTAASAAAAEIAAADGAAALAAAEAAAARSEAAAAGLALTHPLLELRALLGRH